MSRASQTVVLDNEAVQALADVAHPKHRAVLAMLEVTNQRRSRNQRLAVLVPVAVRIEAGWDRTDPGASNLNRISRAADVTLTPAGANRCVELRRAAGEVSVVDVTVAEAAETADLHPVTIVTSDAADMIRLAAHLDATVTVATI